MTNSIKVLENSLYWQQVVLNHSTDPKQKARVKIRIQALEQQITNLIQGVIND